MPEKNPREALSQSFFGDLPTEIIPVIANQMTAIGAQDIISTFYSLNAFRCTSLFFSNNNISNLKTALTAFAHEHLQMASTKLRTLVLKPDGYLFGYGANDHGTLGLGDAAYQSTTYVNEITQVVIPGNNKIKQVSTRDDMTLALSEDGKHLYACGTSHDVKNLTEIMLSLPQDVSIKQIAQEMTTIWLHTSDNKLYSCKLDIQNRTAELKAITVPLNLTIKKITAGDHHLVILATDGKVYGHGDNTQGQLGLQNKKKHESGISQIELPKNVAAISDIAVGNTHTLLLTSQGQLYGCGKNDVGQLGNNKAAVQMNLIKIDIPGLPVNTVITKISTGENHSVVTTADNTVYRCGSNAHGQMGHDKQTSHLDQLTPISVGDKKIVHVIASGHQTMAVADDGKVYSVGEWKEGQLHSANNETAEKAYTAREIDFTPTNKAQLRV